MEKIPKGIVGCLRTKDRGAVIAEAVCFEKSGAAGFSLEENQRRTMHSRLGRKLIDNSMSYYMMSFFKEDHDVRDMIRQIQYYPDRHDLVYSETLVGYDDET